MSNKPVRNSIVNLNPIIGTSILLAKSHDKHSQHNGQRAWEKDLLMVQYIFDLGCENLIRTNKIVHDQFSLLLVLKVLDAVWGDSV